MSLRPEYVLVLGQPLREAEGSTPERKARLLLLDIECVVDCAFEESAENRPAEFGREGVGEDVARNEPLTDWEFERAEARPLKFDGAVETLD